MRKLQSSTKLTEILDFYESIVVSFRVLLIIKSELILVLVDDLAESANARHPIVVVVL